MRAQIFIMMNALQDIDDPCLAIVVYMPLERAHARGVSLLYKQSDLLLVSNFSYLIICVYGVLASCVFITLPSFVLVEMCTQYSFDIHFIGAYRVLIDSPSFCIA